MATDKDNGKKNMQNTAAVNQYKQMGGKVAIESADPHVLTQMLIDGAIERINSSKFFLEQNNVAKKGESISKAITIIDGLRVSLDLEKGGEIAANLESLYDYMQRQLLDANIKNKSENLDEVLSLMNEIRAGWNAIPQEIRKSYKPTLE